MLCREIITAYTEIRTEHITLSVGRTLHVWMLNLVVREVATGL